MGVLRAIVIPLVAAWTLCFASVHSAAQDTPPAPPPPQVVKSADGTASVTVPGDWKLREAETPAAKHLINVFAATPGNVAVRLWSTDDAGPEISETAAAAAHAKFERSRGDMASVTVGALPYPHVLAVTKPGTDPATRVHRFILAGRGIVRVQGAIFAEKSDDLLPALLKMIGSYTTAPRDNLPPPAGYVRSTKPGIECWSAPGVKPADVAKAQAVMAADFAAVEKRYGGARATGVMPPRLFVHADRAACAAVPDTFDESETGFSESRASATVHLYPFDDKDSRVCAQASRRVTTTAIACTFGTICPEWFSFGAELLAFAEVHTGKPHPAMPISTQRLQRPGELDTLEALTAMPFGQIASSRPIDGMAHLLVLRDGPKEYRKALRSFLDLLAKTSDPEQAMKPLLELDQAKLAADARKYLNEKTKWDSSK